MLHRRFFWASGCALATIDWSSGDVSLDDESPEEGATIPCPNCGEKLPEMSMASFSFNKPDGACPTCTGLGTVHEPILARVIDEFPTATTLLARPVGNNVVAAYNELNAFFIALQGAHGHVAEAAADETVEGGRATTAYDVAEQMCRASERDGERKATGVESLHGFSPG